MSTNKRVLIALAAAATIASSSINNFGAAMSAIKPDPAKIPKQRYRSKKSRRKL